MRGLEYIELMMAMEYKELMRALEEYIELRSR